MCIGICLIPHKQSVIERFPLLGEFVKRGSTVHMLLDNQVTFNIIIRAAYRGGVGGGRAFASPCRSAASLNLYLNIYTKGS